ncbi:formate dehydrogenase subunit delta [Consotaella aegiceratis]|uniref:formate dehydrogenase subunit delta n=1 Tax=Consotaella aegiceratis TaxID=3097961 RepID=UPI002F428886
MTPDKLIRMANQMADFFRAAEPDKASAEVAGHINSFWEPRMRAQLLDHVEAAGAGGLDPLAREALPLIADPRQAA